MVTSWKRRAARVGEELEQTGRVAVRSPALARGLECAIRFLLGAVLAAGELFGGYAPFGVGLVACSGAGAEGLCALVGAVFGYLLFRGFTEGIRWAAACVLTFSVAFAFYDVKLCQKSWFMPLTAAVMDAAAGFVYLSDVRWQSAQVVFFSTEILLAGVSAYLYRLAFSPWMARREGAPLEDRQLAGVLYLAVTCLVALAGVTFLRGISLGRALAVLLILACARAAGPGVGAGAGVVLGVAMDLTAGGAPFYTMAYGFAGLLAGAGWQQGRAFQALSYIVANAAAVLWTWSGEPQIAALYETFIATVLFLLLPQSWLRKLGALLTREKEGSWEGKVLALVRERLGGAAEAFRAVGESLRGAFPPAENDGDPAAVFDRAAGRVCRRCALRNTCWEKDYVSTYNALNDALPAMTERGRGEAEDFPGWFASRCLQFPTFLSAVNEELSAYRYRRQYDSRVRESRGAVCREYETLAGVLSQAAAEFSVPLVPDPVRARKLRQHLTALGVEGECRVWYDGAGHLRMEVTGEALAPLRVPGELKKLSALMGLPLRLREDRPGELTFLQAEPLRAVAGQATRRREGQRESGDTGTWFKRPDGSLFVLLCDGMGSGPAAHRESALAVRLLEDFLRAGVDTQAALRTVNSALALRNEETGAFTTVDLLRLDLFTGEGEVCKLGAAPTYLRRGGAVERIVGSALPAGLVDGDSVGPDRTAVQLAAGDCVVLLSDGVAGLEEDGWVRDLLAAFDGTSPKDLAQAIMEESERRVGAADDRTAVVITLKKRE